MAAACDIPPAKPKEKDKEQEKQEKTSEPGSGSGGQREFEAVELGKATAGELLEEPEEGEPNLDSGYAWTILTVMFLISFSVAGSSRVYGLVYARQIALRYYTHEEASWPIATSSTVENLAGVLTPAMARVLSWRQILLLSNTLFILSNLGAYLSSSIALDVLFLGVVQGLALSSITLMLLAINNDYFDRFRITAYGAAMSGGTCGVFFLAPAVNLILDAYPDHFRPVYLFIALVLTLNLALSLLVKPRAETKKYRKWLEIQRRRQTEQRWLREMRRASQQHLAGVDPHRLSVFRRSSRALVERMERKHSIASVSLSIPTRQHSLFGSTGRRESCLQGGSEFAELGAEKGKHPLELAGRLEPPAEPSKQAAAREEAGRPAGLLESLKLLRTPYLHCVWIMLAIYYLVSRIFFIVLADFGLDRGLSSAQATQLLNFWSLGELLARVVLAPLIDLRWYSVKSCVVLTCSLIAAVMSLMVALGHFYVYAGCSLLTAALVSLEYMLINTLMVDYLGKDKAIGCYSLAALISSLILFTRPSLIGYFRDQLGSYDGLFLLLAAVCFLYALLFGLLEPLFVRRWPKTGGF